MLLLGHLQLEPGGGAYRGCRNACSFFLEDCSGKRCFQHCERSVLIGKHAAYVRQLVGPVHGIPSPHAVDIQNLWAVPSITNDALPTNTFIRRQGQDPSMCQLMRVVQCRTACS